MYIMDSSTTGKEQNKMSDFTITNENGQYQIVTCGCVVANLDTLSQAEKWLVDMAADIARDKSLGV
jgi:hypothetical protein